MKFKIEKIKTNKQRYQRLQFLPYNVALSP